MKILINASKEKAGGGMQVSDSICTNLNKYPEHHFFVILPIQMHNTYLKIKYYKNVTLYEHTFKDSFYTLLTGHYSFLDNIVEKNQIDVVFTVFGPCRWVPKILHVCGFARAQLLMPESPYYTQMGFLQKLKCNMHNKVLGYFFKRSAKIFYSENEMISQRVRSSFDTKCYTITNFYNQVFDNKKLWRSHILPDYDGTTLLTISAVYPHKNLNISIKIAQYLKDKYPDFKCRFVFTATKEEFSPIESSLMKYFCFIGRVDVSECPSLYQQCDIAFQPSLLECFTATYPEAMRMERPILTTNLQFAKGLCGEAAIYYEPTDYKEAAELIYKLATDEKLKQKLVENGLIQLDKFDNYDDRLDKIIQILIDEYKIANNGNTIK